MMYIDDEQEQNALDILLSSGAKVDKNQPIKGAIFMTLKPTEESKDDVTDTSTQNETD